jgi:hypothetical protein
VPATSRGNSSDGGSTSGKEEKKKKRKKRKKSKKMPRRPLRNGVNAMSFVRTALIAFATLLPRPTAAFSFPGFLASPRDETLGGTMSSTFAVGGEPVDLLYYGLHYAYPACVGRSTKQAGHVQFKEGPASVRHHEVDGWNTCLREARGPRWKGYHHPEAWHRLDVQKCEDEAKGKAKELEDFIVKWNKEISPKGFGYASRSTFDGPRVWIADTGASYDLIGEEDIPAASRSGRRPLDVPVDINTANGTLPVTDTCPIQIKVLRSVVEPIILPCVPPVLSVGQRVMTDGFDFRWGMVEIPCSLRRGDKKSR